MGQSLLKEIMVAEPNRHDVIHYTNSESPPLQEVKDHAKSWFHIPADDIDYYGLRNYFPPTAKNVKDALAWSEGKTELIVACHAGISRSSATAYLIAARVMGAKDALSILEENHHWPNRLIVYLGSNLLKNGQIWYEYVNWQKSYNHIDPSQNNTWPSEELKSQIYWD